jgi:hypothetical protein
MLSNGRIIDELEINLKGRCSGPVEAPSWNIPAETEGNHEKIIDSRCPGRDSNRAPQEHKSRVLPLHKLVMPRRFSKIVFHKNDI